MKHIIINSYATFLGLRSERLTIKQDGKTLKEVALSRIKTIQIHSKGVSLSSDLVLACSKRGIKIFFDSYGAFGALHTLYEHKSVVVRQQQYDTCQSDRGIELARQLIIGKLKNQRATLLYSSRGISNSAKDEVIAFFDSAIAQLRNRKTIGKQVILGIEGSSANYYFRYLKEASLLPPTFELRTKRHSQEITNIALNYGYAILSNFIYKACINAGLEPYMGVLHSTRSAKPSLVLDVMEEYRSFVVDRNIIKMRKKLSKAKEFNSIKRDVAKAILSTLTRRYSYNHRKLKLESIIQRQLYRMSGYFCGEKKYRSYVFRW